MFSNLKERGVEKVHLFISDEHKSIKNAMQNSFPESRWQRCFLHVVSEMSKSIIGNTNDRKRFSKELYSAFKENNELQVRIKLNEVINQWKEKSKVKHSKTHYDKNPIVLINMFENTLDSEGLFTYLEFDRSIRKELRTNNLIESMN